MASDHWRAGIGYLTVADPPGLAAAPPAAPPPTPQQAVNHWRSNLGYHTVEAPAAVAEAPLVWQFAAQAPPPAAMTAPNGFRIPEAQGFRPNWGGFYGWPTGTPMAAPAPAAVDNAPGHHLVGGIPPGLGYLFTGKPCCVHVTEGNSPSAILSQMQHSESFFFHAHKATTNSSMNELIMALGGKAGSTITQYHEQGNHAFRQGTTWVQGSDAAKATLESLGWAGAGDNVRQPIWLGLVK